jgi:PAS domain S-box-containing protein
MALRQLPGFEGRRLARLTALITGGAPNPAAHIRQWLNDGVTMINAWGMSEICSGTAQALGDRQRLLDNPSAIGLPHLTLDMKLVDSGGQEVGSGRAGEIWVRGWSVTPGYWERPDLDAHAFAGTDAPVAGRLLQPAFSRESAAPHCCCIVTGYPVFLSDLDESTVFPKVSEDYPTVTLNSVCLGGWTWSIRPGTAADNATGTHAPVDYSHSLDPDRRPGISDAIGHLVPLGGADSFHMEYRLAVAGHELWVRARGTVERREDGVAVSLPGISIDITHQRELLNERTRVLEDSLRQARIFDTTLAAIRDFVSVFDLQGEFRYANKALLELFGMTLAEAVGKDFIDLKLPASLASRLQRQIQLVIDSGQTLSDETAYESPTGVSGFYEYIFCPIFAADGSVEAVAGSTRDITKRKQIEEDLRRRTLQFETLLNQTPLGIYLIDADLRIREANPRARTFFGDIPDLLGRDIEQITRRLWPDPHANELLKRVRHTLTTGEMSVMADLFDFSLGPKATYRYRGSIHRILGDDGRPGAVCYFRGHPVELSA